MAIIGDEAPIVIDLAGHIEFDALALRLAGQDRIQWIGRVRRRYVRFGDIVEGHARRQALGEKFGFNAALPLQALLRRQWNILIGDIIVFAETGRVVP